MKEKIWTPAGLASVRWFKENGRIVPILSVATPTGVVNAGLVVSSSRWKNSAVFATFKSLDGKEFSVNTRLFDGGKLQDFCAAMIRQRSAQKKKVARQNKRRAA